MRHFVTMSLSATRTNKFKPKNVGLREYNDSFQSGTTLTEGPSRKMLACESVTAPVQPALNTHRASACVKKSSVINT